MGKAEVVRMTSRAQDSRAQDSMGDTRRSIQRVEKALVELRKGRMVILTDDESRENEGDLVLAAEKVTPQAINFMATHGRGLIPPVADRRAGAPASAPVHGHGRHLTFNTAFTVSIEAARGVTTGISARDRAVTVKAAVAPNARPGDLVRPGHIFPLSARAGGVLVRTGQTEGSVDLARLAGLEPAGVICEIMKDDGTMARRPDLERFARKHRLLVLSVADVIRFRLEREPLVRRVSEGNVELAGLGHPEGFRAIAYRSEVDAHTHVALVRGNPGPRRPTLVRVHTACFVGDVLGSVGCDCGATLKQSLRRSTRPVRVCWSTSTKKPRAPASWPAPAPVRSWIGSAIWVSALRSSGTSGSGNPPAHQPPPPHRGAGGVRALRGRPRRDRRRAKPPRLRTLIEPVAVARGISPSCCTWWRRRWRPWAPIHPGSRASSPAPGGRPSR